MTDNVNERLARLERDSRRIKLVGALMLALLIAVFLLGQAPKPTPPASWQRFAGAGTPVVAHARGQTEVPDYVKTPSDRWAYATFARWVRNHFTGLDSLDDSHKAVFMSFLRAHKDDLKATLPVETPNVERTGYGLTPPAQSVPEAAARFSLGGTNAAIGFAKAILTNSVAAPSSSRTSGPNRAFSAVGDALAAACLSPVLAAAACGLGTVNPEEMAQMLGALSLNESARVTYRPGKLYPEPSITPLDTTWQDFGTRAAEAEPFLVLYLLGTMLGRRALTRLRGKQMKLSKSDMRLIVVWVAVLLIVAMGLFPPSTYGGEYHWLFSASPGRVDVTRLLIQWVCVAFLSGAAVWSLKEKPER